MSEVLFFGHLVLFKHMSIHGLSLISNEGSLVYKICIFLILLKFNQYTETGLFTSTVAYI